MSNIESIKNRADLETKLSESELSQYHNFSNNIRKLQYLLAHTLVKDVCDENVTVSKNGTPTIKSGFISIAHKDNWVVVAVSDSLVGIDIENTNIIRDFTGQSELLNLPKTNDKKVFYRNFVEYESRFKYGKDSTKAYMYFYEFDNYLIGICTAEQYKDIQFILS